jgi:hypothetical protein
VAEGVASLDGVGVRRADAGKGPAEGIAHCNSERRVAGQTVPENGLDVFHTTQEAQRVLRQHWQRVERLWEAAEAAEAVARHAGQQGQDRRGPAARVRRAWERAVAAFEAYERGEAGWAQARPALAVFRPDGRLNDRPWAQQQIAAALPELCGRDWAKVRGFLAAAESLTFLDRLHRQLEQAEPEAALRGSWCGCGGCVGSGRGSATESPVAVGTWRTWCRW